MWGLCLWADRSQDKEIRGPERGAGLIELNQKLCGPDLSHNRPARSCGAEGWYLRPFRNQVHRAFAGVIAWPALESWSLAPSLRALRTLWPLWVGWSM